MHMICDSTHAERLHFIPLCDPAHERPKSFLDFINQQRFAVFGAENRVNIKRRECIGHQRTVNSIVPLGRDQIAKPTTTGDESPAYFRIVPPGLAPVAAANQRAFFSPAKVTATATTTETGSGRHRRR